MSGSVKQTTSKTSKASGSKMSKASVPISGTSSQKSWRRRDDVSPIKTIRRAKDIDHDWIKHLIDETENFKELYGDFDFDYKFHRSYINFVVLNEIGDRVAAVCLDDHPNLPSVPASDWPNWLHTLYGMDEITVKNSLWVHFMVCDKKYTFKFLKPLMEHIFVYFGFIQLSHVLIISPPGVELSTFMDGYFSRVIPIECGTSVVVKVQCVHVAVRHHFAKEFTIRRAVEEDNDDLVAIFDTNSKKLKELYGEFYISEILTKHPEVNRQLVVAEYRGNAVAAICLNEDVNYLQLNKNFELACFNHLRKLAKDEHQNLIPDQLYPDTQSYSSKSTDLDVPVPSIPSDTVSRTETFSSAPGQPSLQSGSNIEQENVNLEAQSSEELEVTTKMSDLDYDFSGIQMSKSYKSKHHVVLKESKISKTSEKSKQSLESKVIKDYVYDDECTSGEDEDEELGEIEFTNPSDSEFDVKGKRKKIFKPGRPDFEELFMQREKNAFCLELMAADADFDEEVTCNLLEACFQCFPDRDYLVMSVPSNKSPFPLLNYFVRVTPAKCSIYPHELYVLHKNAIKPDLEVRPARLEDREQIEQLISTQQIDQPITQRVLQSIYYPLHEFQTYVLLNYSKVVAFANYQEDFDFEFMAYKSSLRDLVEVKAFRYESTALYKYICISPIFQRHAKFFLREIHRQSDKGLFFYKIKHRDVKASLRGRSSANCLDDLLPTKIIRQPIYHETDHYSVPECCYRETPDFYLFISTPQVCSYRRYDINSKIVVVGSGAAGLGFLEELFYSFDYERMVNFNNVTLVHRHKLGNRNLEIEERYLMMIFKGLYTFKYLTQIALKVHATFVRGFMTAINRRNKYITIDGDKILPYDILVLACGEQYHLPTKLIPKVEIEHSLTDTESEPANIFVVNHHIEAEINLRKVLTMVTGRKKYTIMVYGSTLHAYCCVATLQKIGIPNKNIAFVEPFPSQAQYPSVRAIVQPEIDHFIMEQLVHDGVKVYSGYYFVEWDYDTKYNIVKSVTLKSFASGFITIDVLAIFWYDNLNVDFKTFMAINNAGLVYDGRIIIDNLCRTNDSCIYAVGSMTRYAKKYYAEDDIHKYYNTFEIAKRLANHIKAMLLPGGLEKNEGDPILTEISQWDLLVPKYIWPITKHAYLPGGYNYMFVTSPGKPLPHEIRIKKKGFGRIISTGCLDPSIFMKGEDPNYFAIQINKRKFVESITCFSKKNIDVHNISRLWGKNEKLLNSILYRYDLGYIDDFFEFFKQPMFYAIYFSQFRRLENKVMDILQRYTDKPGESVIEELFKIEDENHIKRASRKQEHKILAKFIESGYYEEITKCIMDYIGDNISYLPMFAHHIISKMFLMENERSPLFKKPNISEQNSMTNM